MEDGASKDQRYETSAGSANVSRDTVLLLSFWACLHPMKKINPNVLQNQKKLHLIMMLSRIALTLGVALVQAGLRAEDGACFVI